MTTLNPAQQFIKELFKLKRANKNKWITCTAEIRGIPIRCKSYNNWVQILQVGDTKYTGPMDCRAKDMKQFLESALFPLVEKHWN